jgi:hypothetical protein
MSAVRVTMISKGFILLTAVIEPRGTGTARVGRAPARLCRGKIGEVPSTKPSVQDGDCLAGAPAARKKGQKVRVEGGNPAFTTDKGFLAQFRGLLYSVLNFIHASI